MRSVEQPGLVGGLVLLHEGGVQPHGNQQVQVSSAATPIKPVELTTTKVVLEGEDKQLLEVPGLLEGKNIAGFSSGEF